MTEVYVERTTCRICGSTNLIPILDIGMVSIVYFPKPDEPDPPKVPLELVRCDGECGLVQLKHTTNPDLLWKADYWHRSSTNSKMVSVLIDTVREIEKRIVLNDDDTVIDIGSNDSTMLKQYQNKKLYTIGFEPSNIGKEQSTMEGVSRIINDYFRVHSSSGINWLYEVAEEGIPEAYAFIKAKVVTSIAMFYDLDDPHKFIEDVKKVLREDGMWVIQIAYLPKMLENNAFDGICSEHLCYYHLKPLKYLLEKHNLEIFTVQPVDINEGSIRVFVGFKGRRKISKTVGETLESESKLELDVEVPYRRFKNSIKQVTGKISSTVKKANRKGKTVAVYGDSTKGITILSSCKLTSKEVSFAVERQEQKYGRVMPGSRIFIVSEEEFRLRKPDYTIILPWTFASVFIEREKEYLDKGGKFIVPLPEFRIVERGV